MSHEQVTPLARCAGSLSGARFIQCVRRRTAPWRRADGSATVTACLALAALIVMTALVVQFGAVVVARHRAQAAADLAALAAAGELWNGAESGCAAAESIGQRAGVVRCEIDGWDAVIAIEEKVPLGPFGEWSIRAVARAGPVEEAA